MDENREPLGKIIKRLMRRNDWTQKELAQRAGVAQQYISQIILSDRYNPTLDVAERIADAFGVSLDYLVDGREHLIDTLAPDEQEILALFRSIPPGDIRENLLESVRLFARTFAGKTVKGRSGESNTKPSSR